MSNLVVDMDVDAEDMDKLFDVMNFLDSNKDVIISDIRPLALEYLERESSFTGPFQRAFRDGFVEFISDLLKDKVMENLNLNFEEASILMDPDLMEATGLVDEFTDREMYTVEQ